MCRPKVSSGNGKGAEASLGRSKGSDVTMSESPPVTSFPSSMVESGYQFLKRRSEYFINGVRTDILEGEERFEGGGGGLAPVGAAPS